MNRPRISYLIFLATIVICLVTTVAHAHNQIADANRQHAELLWEKAIEAKGGRQQLHSVNSFVISSTIDIFVNSSIFGEQPRTSHVDSETERLYVMPGKAWLYEFTPSFSVSLEGTVMDTERNLCLVTLAPIGPMHSVPGLTPCVPTIWSERLIQDPVIYLMETKWVRPLPLRARTEGKGKKQQDVIETEVGKLRVDFYLDRKTNLPVKLVTDNFGGDPRLTRPMGLMITLEDYVDVDGIQMPRRIIREPLGHRDVIRRDTERARYKFNVAYNEEIFKSPVSRKAKPDDWKARQN